MLGKLLAIGLLIFLGILLLLALISVLTTMVVVQVNTVVANVFWPVVIVLVPVGAVVAVATVTGTSFMGAIQLIVSAISSAAHLFFARVGGLI